MFIWPALRGVHIHFCIYWSDTLLTWLLDYASIIIYTTQLTSRLFCSKFENIVSKFTYKVQVRYIGNYVQVRYSNSVQVRYISKQIRYTSV